MSVTQFNKRWHSPSNAYMHLENLKEKLGLPEIEKRPQYKRVREARVAMIVAFVLTKILSIPAFFRLPKNDPPDVFLIQPDKGDMNITTVELTSYRPSKESCLEQLIRTKKISNKYSNEYLMVLHLFTEDKVDYQAINDYAIAHKIPFPIWSVRNIQNDPDTIAEVVIMNPNVIKLIVNIGEEASNFKQNYNVPHVVFSKQAWSMEEVRSEKLDEECNIAPWENVEE